MFKKILVTLQKSLEEQSKKLTVYLFMIKKHNSIVLI